MNNDPSGLICIGILLNLLVFTPIGAVIGHYARGRAAEGAGLGFLLGPIGWAVILALQDFRRRCQACQKIVPNYKATVCYHCHSPIPPDVKPTAEIPHGESLLHGLMAGGFLAFVLYAGLGAAFMEESDFPTWPIVPATLIGLAVGYGVFRFNLRKEGKPPFKKTPWG